MGGAAQDPSQRRGAVKDPHRGPGPILEAAPPLGRCPIPTAPKPGRSPAPRGPLAPLQVDEAAVDLGPISPPPRQRCAPQQGLDSLHQAAGDEAPGHLIAGMDESGAMPWAPAGLPAVQQPPALAPLLKQHQGCGSGTGHQQHPSTDAPLLQTEQHLNSGEITREGIGHGHGAKDPPSRRPRARAGDEAWPPCPRREEPPAGGQLAEPLRECRSMERVGGVTPNTRHWQIPMV